MKRTSGPAPARMIWSRRTCCDASPSPGSPITRNAKSPPEIPAARPCSAPAGSTAGRRREHRTRHRDAPGVGALLGPGVVDPGRPVLRVEIPAHAPDGHGGDDDRDQRQAHLQGALGGERERVAHLMEPDPDAQAPDEVEAKQPVEEARRALDGPSDEPRPPAALERPRRAAQREPCRAHHAERQEHRRRRRRPPPPRSARSGRSGSSRPACGRREWRRGSPPAPGPSVGRRAGAPLPPAPDARRGGAGRDDPADRSPGSSRRRRARERAT